MNILVTGGLGLIGHNIVQKLTRLGHKVIVYDNCTNYGIIPQLELDYLLAERRKLIGDVEVHEMDILQGSMFDWLLPKHNIEAIIHLASFPRQKVVNANPVWGSTVMSGGLLILLEAAAANCPLIISDIPEHKEIFDKKSAIFVPLDNFKKLSEAILFIINKPGYAKKMAKAAWVKINDMTIENQFTAYDKIYKNLLKI